MKQSFPQKKYYDEDGFYVTGYQLTFFTNDSKGKVNYFMKDPSFLYFIGQCKIYNFISDLMDKDEQNITMCWDEDQEEICFVFPQGGEIARVIKKLI